MKMLTDLFLGCTVLGFAELLGEGVDLLRNHNELEELAMCPTASPAVRHLLSTRAELWSW